MRSSRQIQSARIFYRYDLSSNHRSNGHSMRGKGSAPISEFPETLATDILQGFPENVFKSSVHLEIVAWIRTKSRGNKKMKAGGACKPTEDAVKSRALQCGNNIIAELETWMRVNIRDDMYSRDEAIERLQRGVQLTRKYTKKGANALNAFMPPVSNETPEKAARRSAAAAAWKASMAARRSGEAAPSSAPSNNGAANGGLPPMGDVMDAIKQFAPLFIPDEDGKSLAGSVIKAKVDEMGGTSALKEQFAPALDIFKSVLEDAGYELVRDDDDAQDDDEEKDDDGSDTGGS